MLESILTFFRTPEDSDKSFIKLVRNILIFTLLATVLPIAAVASRGSAQATINILLITSIIEIIALIQVLRKKVILAKIIVPIVLVFAVTIISYNADSIHDIAIVAYPVIIIIGTLLQGQRALFTTTPLVILSFLTLGVLDLQGVTNTTMAASTGVDDIVIGIILIIGSNGILNLLVDRLNRATREAIANEKAQLEANLKLRELQVNLESRVEERSLELNKRASQLEAIADVARSIAAIQNLEELLTTITKVISSRFNFYHVGIFLLNEAEDFAILRATNSEGGQKMLTRGHRLRVGSEGIVGYATGRRKARIALDTGADAAYFDNPDLPNTRSEVALPLSLGDTIVGALDIQSTEPNAFTGEDIASFTVLADQVTIAIQNALSIERAQIATAEAEATSRQLIGQAWSEIKKTEAVTGFHFDGMSIKSLSEPTSSKERNNKMLSIPIRLRNEVIGNLSVVHPEENKAWTEDEIAIFQSTAERIALAAENARLLEASQRQVAKERTIFEGATRVSSALDVESILKATVEELERTLGDSDIIIQLESGE